MAQQDKVPPRPAEALDGPNCGKMEKPMGFTRVKDHLFNTYDVFAGWLARRPRPVRLGAYAIIGSIMWSAYLLPGNRVRPTMVALSRQVGRPSARKLFGAYVRRLISGLDLAERVRHGFGAEVDGLLTIDDEQRLGSLLGTGGVFLGLPHLHASVAMTRALAKRYPVLLIARLTTNKKRADAQRHLFAQLGCEVVDARNEPSSSVARKTLRALRSGKIVIGTVDRIRPPPSGDGDAARGQVRSMVFGQPVGVESWPTRFAMEAKASIVPATVRQTGEGLRLILGKAVLPTASVEETTQIWLDEVAELIRENPEEWSFCLDKHWSTVLIASQRS
jgi:KDO2-lipid IV(A) lauroyltransferase